MRPANNSTATTGVDGGLHLNSPMPYLFGGLAFVLGLIAIALLILACSYRKSLSNSSSENAEKAATKQVEIEVLDSEPKIAVIMAGEENPTYLAKPVSCNSCNYSEQV